MVNWVTMEAVKGKPLSFINTNGLQNKVTATPHPQPPLFRVTVACVWSKGVGADSDLMTHKPGQSTSTFKWQRHVHECTSHRSQKRIFKVQPQTCQVLNDSRHINRSPAANTKVMCVAFEIAEHSGYREQNACTGRTRHLFGLSLAASPGHG